MNIVVVPHTGRKCCYEFRLGFFVKSLTQTNLLHKHKMLQQTIRKICGISRKTTIGLYKSIFARCVAVDQIITWALHIGQVFSRSNQVDTHSSQKMCLQCNFVGSDKLSWQIGQVPPVAFTSSWLGLFP